MQTASSASCTWSDSLSAMEYTACRHTNSGNREHVIPVRVRHHNTEKRMRCFAMAGMAAFRH
jgi:hypothetical protein